MIPVRRWLRVFAAVAGAAWISVQPGAAVAQGDTPAAGESPDPQQVLAGKAMYREGVLPSGELMTGTYAGDVAVSGQQVICGACHRRSGLGSSEGQEVVRAVTGDILYAPLRLPTSKPPLAPEQRPAYTDETLKRAIRAGIGADGKPLNTLMPRYPLPDEDLDALVAYLKTLSSAPDPGVTEHEIHFATVLSDSVDSGTRKAVLDVLQAFIEQKNAETRHETRRAEHAPWHKQWIYGAYRKWVLHVWELEGSPESWAEQLRAHYEKQPVFALLSGAVAGAWRPVHDFCEQNEVPCLFPNTDLPVVDESSFYTVYLSRGMMLEADAVARHLADGGLLSGPVVQVYRAGEPRGEAAAARLRQQVRQQGGRVDDFVLSEDPAPDDALWREVAVRSGAGAVVSWLGADATGLWDAAAGGQPRRIYLSTTLYGVNPAQIPRDERERVYLVHPYELPAALPRLLARSTGWLKVKGIYAPEAQREQANAFFALKMAGGALKTMRGFFVREYLIERIEHMADSASYTSVYPRISLAPGQRFVSRGAYVARFGADESGQLVAEEAGWLVPGSN